MSKASLPSISLSIFRMYVNGRNSLGCMSVCPYFISPLDMISRIWYHIVTLVLHGHQRHHTHNYHHIRPYSTIHNDGKEMLLTFIPDPLGRGGSPSSSWTLMHS
jgi:hypothetical protein